MLSQEISLQRSSISSHHFEQVLNGQADKRDVIPYKRFCPGKRVFVLEVMADLQVQLFNIVNT